MDIFLDSSKIGEAKKWDSVIDGATTNPTIILKDGGCDIAEFVKFFGDRPVSVEATGNFEDDARKYSQLGENVVIKIPLLTTDGGNNLDLISRLSEDGIAINCTALFSLSQVLLAAKAGAKYVSLFVGRIDDEGGDWYSILEECVDCLAKYAFHTELIVGSIRTVGMVRGSVLAGADIATIPPGILEKMVMHKFSLDTVRMFERDSELLKVPVG